ncbi:hypothetical protein EMPG_16477 [Blastomyces silverae]|uniref:Uncharacterized protein n=1 Tax=Blastomyces silverae TaxID=2060906 RepID=A0A0H1B9L6_9EURO|nr:hypothetical protein EMPG_16477 [Blastomyces silverae]
MAVFLKPLLIAFPILLLRFEGVRGDGVFVVDLGFGFVAVVDFGAAATASAGPGARAGARPGATSATGAAAGGFCDGGPSHGSQSRHLYETLKVAYQLSHMGEHGLQCNGSWEGYTKTIIATLNARRSNPGQAAETTIGLSTSSDPAHLCEDGTSRLKEKSGDNPRQLFGI